MMILRSLKEKNDVFSFLIRLWNFPRGFLIVEFFSSFSLAIEIFVFLRAKLFPFSSPFCSTIEFVFRFEPSFSNDFVIERVVSPLFRLSSHCVVSFASSDENDRRNNRCLWRERQCSRRAEFSRRFGVENSKLWSRRRIFP